MAKGSLRRTTQSWCSRTIQLDGCTFSRYITFRTPRPAGAISHQGPSSRVTILRRPWTCRERAGNGYGIPRAAAEPLDSFRSQRERAEVSRAEDVAAAVGRNRDAKRFSSEMRRTAIAILVFLSAVSLTARQAVTGAASPLPQNPQDARPPRDPNKPNDAGTGRIRGRVIGGDTRGAAAASHGDRSTATAMSRRVQPSRMTPDVTSSKRWRLVASVSPPSKADTSTSTTDNVAPNNLDRTLISHQGKPSMSISICRVAVPSRGASPMALENQLSALR